MEVATCAEGSVAALYVVQLIVRLPWPFDTCMEGKKSAAVGVDTRVLERNSHEPETDLVDDAPVPSPTAMKPCPNAPLKVKVFWKKVAENWVAAKPAFCCAILTTAV